MEDILKAAGVAADDDIPRRTKKSKREGGQSSTASVDEFGGHNLRAVIGTRSRDGQPSSLRPRSKLSTAAARDTLAAALGSDAMGTLATPQKANTDMRGGDEYDDDDDDDADDDDDDEYDADDAMDDDQADPEGQEDIDAKQGQDDIKATLITTAKSVTTPGRTAPSTTPTLQPFALTTVKDDSVLGNAAAKIFTAPGYSLTTDLMWQTGTGSDAAKSRAFRQEVTQQVEVTPFAFMRPSSPFVQILHSVATYAVRGGDSELHGKEFGFIGDRTSLRIPTPVMVDDSMWKWFTKQVGMDVPPIQGFYANKDNAKRLYYDSASGGDDANVPRMIYLPPPFLAFCLETQRTPFELHEFVARYATRDGSDITVGTCTLLMDWCVVATQTAKASTPTTSMLAITFQTAPTDDDTFLRWLYKIDRTGDSSPLPPGAVGPPQPPQPPAGAPPHPTGAPAPDVWAQMAKSISSSFATAAAAMKPATTDDDPNASYEFGGKLYDKFQMATVKGFAHVYDLADVPAIWALFQYTKHLETHKDNLRRKMQDWANSPARAQQVQIDRSFFIPDATMKEILSLQFNPGGMVPEPDEADSGLSILICRARTMAAKAAIRKFEKAKEQSKRNRSMAEAESELATPAYDMGALPDDYNELLRCVGTYCALLFTLFGEKCQFYKHCFALYTTMNSDLVYEQRHTFFTVLYCRQIVWAVLAESRVYFSRRLSIDDFAVNHPDDVVYPRSQLMSIVPLVRDGTPIIRASFPDAWYPVGHARSTAAGGSTTAVTRGVGAAVTAPVQSIATPQGGGGAATVVSGLTTGTARAPRPPVVIRSTNIHPKIKLAMEAYIAKHKAVYLTAMLNHVNLTMDDLPKPSQELDSGTVCYNFILGRCAVDRCQHEHVNASEITDEFATDLLSKIRPSITEFMANGLPPGTKRRRGPRRPRRE